jgi:dsDNA-binding SOS-regulon protein
MTLRWAKESQSMDYQKTASTFITKEGRLVSTDNGDWIYEFMPKKEADNMDAKLESIEQNSNTIITLMMSATKEDVIDICKTWDRATDGDVYAWLRISSFVDHLISNMKNHLEGDDE